MTIGLLSIVGLIAACLVMLIAWWIAVRICFYSLVDVVWAYGIAVLVGLYAVLSDGTTLHKAIAIGMSALWGLRLGTHLLLRLKSHFPHEDSRYEKLSQEWSKGKFLLFFQFQAISQVIFALPFALMVQNTGEDLLMLEWIGVAVFLAALLLEALADLQLKRFRQNPMNRGKVCNVGLWRFSRHPNYFFEWLIWCGVALTALDTQNGFIGLVSPIAMFYVLNYVTGVPAAEAQSLASRGQAYRDYQSRTSRFFPWFPK